MIAITGGSFSLNAPDISLPEFDRKGLGKSVSDVIGERNSESKCHWSAYIDSEGVYHPSETR